MRTLRTPDDRFTDLPDFDFEPSYAEVSDQDGGTLRMAYVEAGPPDGPVVLLLHGEPSWSFLYRRSSRCWPRPGSACVAPDLVGFGRSDKPAEPPTTPTPGTSSGCGRCCSTRWTCATSRSSARTGAA